jgi:predicted SAM-dependent methyltransferase
MTKERYLHIGCGGVILPSPFENLDTRELPGVDHIGDAFPLAFEDNTFDLVYSSHVLEHFRRDETQAVINEWVRVLKPGGTLRLSVPSIESLIKIYQASEDLEYIIGPLMGGQTYPQNFHYNMFDKKYLTNYLEVAGCEAVHPWDYRRTSHSKFFDFSQATTWEIPISLNLEARKK